MSINPLKDFFKKKKAEIKFARAGPGQSLASDTGNTTQGPSSAGPSEQSARQAAAEAAMKRFNKDTSGKPSQKPRLTTETRTLGSGPSTAPPQRVVASGSHSEQQPPANTQKDLPVVDGIAQRNLQIFSTDELAQRIKKPDIDDDFFKLTVDDAKLYKQRCDEERARNEILRTSEMRRREAEAKKPTTNVARLRFKLPNDKIVEASFAGHETLALVRDWLVAVCMEKLSLKFKDFDILMGMRPFKDADFQKTIKQLGLIPATSLAVVHKDV